LQVWAYQSYGALFPSLHGPFGDRSPSQAHHLNEQYHPQWRGHQQRFYHREARQIHQELNRCNPTYVALTGGAPIAKFARESNHQTRIPAETDSFLLGVEFHLKYSRPRRCLRGATPQFLFLARQWVARNQESWGS